MIKKILASKEDFRFVYSNVSPEIMARFSVCQFGKEIGHIVYSRSLNNNLFIDLIKVEVDHRGKGVGTFLLSNFLRDQIEKNSDIQIKLEWNKEDVRGKKLYEKMVKQFPHNFSYSSFYVEPLFAGVGEL